MLKRIKTKGMTNKMMMNSIESRYGDIIEEAHRRYPNVPHKLLTALIAKESRGDPNAPGVGTTAYGLTQLTNAAAKDVGITNKGDPYQSIMGGAAYLSDKISRFGSEERGLAAYNQGAGHVDYPAGAEYAKDVERRARQ